MMGSAPVGTAPAVEVPCGTPTPPRGEPRWLTDEEQRGWRNYLRMTQVLNLALERNLQHNAQMSQADFGVLVVLSEAPHNSLRGVELARELHWEKSRLSHQLRRMETRGLIGKSSCPEDGRGVVFSLTDQGRHAVETAAAAHVEAVRAHFVDILGPDRLDAVSAASRLVLDNLLATEPSDCVEGPTCE